MVRLDALAKAKSQIGVREKGFNNRGPKVDEYQRADDLPGVGYAWCMAFVQWCYKAIGHPLDRKTASVGFFVDWARKMGYIVKRPFRGDLVAFQFTNDTWPDHIGFVEKVLRITPNRLILRTVEGNTSRGDVGSQDDGGGVWRRTRFVDRRKVIFVRMPDEAFPPKRTVIKRSR